MDTPAVYPVGFSCAVLSMTLPMRHVTITLLSPSECEVRVSLGTGSAASWSGAVADLGTALQDLALRIIPPAATA